MKGSENYMSVRGANASRNRTHDVLRRGTGLLVRTALIVWMAGAFGSTTAHAQGPLGQGDAIAKYREALEDADELLPTAFNFILRSKCVVIGSRDDTVEQAKSLIKQLTEVKYEPELPQSVDGKDTAKAIDTTVADLERVVQLLSKKTCSPPPAAASAPPSPPVRKLRDLQISARIRA